jgi:hypothetical protein
MSRNRWQENWNTRHEKQTIWILYYEQKKWFFCFEVFKANAYNALIFLTFFSSLIIGFSYLRFFSGLTSQSSSSLSPVALSPSSFSSLPVAIVVIIVSCRAVDCRRRHHRCRPSPRRHHCLRINTGTTNFSLGIPISVWGYQTKTGIPEPKWGCESQRIPKPIRGSPKRNGDQYIPIPKRGSQNLFGDCSVTNQNQFGVRSNLGL